MKLDVTGNLTYAPHICTSHMLQIKRETYTHFLNNQITLTGKKHYKTI